MSSDKKQVPINHALMDNTRKCSDSESASSPQKYYLLVYNSSESQPIVAIQEVEPTLECQDIVRDFRAAWFES